MREYGMGNHVYFPDCDKCKFNEKRCLIHGICEMLGQMNGYKPINKSEVIIPQPKSCDDEIYKPEKKYDVSFSISEPYLKRYETSTTMYAPDEDFVRKYIHEKYKERGNVVVGKIKEFKDV